MSSVAKQSPESTHEENIDPHGGYIRRVCASATDSLTLALTELADVLLHVDDDDERTRGQRVLLDALLVTLRIQRAAQVGQ